MSKRLTLTPYLFLAPALVVIAVFVLYPIVAVVYYSFTSYDIVNPPVWIGLQKTRLLDPTLNMIGTNDHAGDYRASGCAAWS